MNIKRDIRFRVYVAFTGVCVFGAAILIKAATIQVKEGPQLRTLAKEMHTDTTTLDAERGNIYTESGALLCSSIPQFDIHIDFTVVKPKVFQKNIDTLSECLSHLFKDASAARYKQELESAYNSGARYFLLARDLPYYQYETLRTFPIFNKGRAYGGFIADSKIKRINPYGMLAYRTIGLWRQNSRTIGLEATYDSVLTGENGSCVVQKETGGVWVPVDGSEIEPQNGKDIVTTLDIGIQDVAEHAMMSVMQQYQCLYGTCVVMEVKTGKIRALVNLGRQKDGSYWEDFNYAMMPTEPGSTFKAATLLSLLNDKYVTINDMIDAQGGITHFGNRTLRDADGDLHLIHIKEAFAHSSNVSFATLAYRYYYKDPQKFINDLKALHLNVRTGIDLMGERRPLVKSPESRSWSATTLPWMGIGYEVLVSPLQTCMLYNAVANNGTMMRPYLVSAIREYGKDIKTYQPKVLIQHIGDSSTIAQVKACMRAVVTEGTAKSIGSPFYDISGKTGTAQVADKGIRYTDGVYQGSFVGFFPSEHPKYTIAVVIRTKPHSSAYYGATIAAPVFRMIADKIFAYNIGSWDGPLDSLAHTGHNDIVGTDATLQSYKVLLHAFGRKTDEMLHPSGIIASIATDTLTNRVSVMPAPVYVGQVPNVKGMGLKDAVYLLENQGMHVDIKGRGTVKNQSLAPGTKITKGENITLELS